jgi:membrane fusion protein, multidrug efflux system
MADSTERDHAAEAPPRLRHPHSAGAASPTDASERRPPKEHRRAPDAHDGPSAPPWYRRPLPAGIAAVVLIALVVGGVLWWRHSRQYESTDDAFVDVVSQRVSPQVAGRVLRVLVNDNEDVAAGQVLFELDPEELQARLAQAQAARVQAEAQLAQAEAQRTIRAAEVDQARAAAAAVATGAANAANDLKRLLDARAGDEAVASAQQVEHARADERSTAAQQRASDKSVAAAEAQLTLVARQIEAARAAVQSATAQMTQAELLLSYTEVKASAAGRVANKTVAAGDYVEPGTPLMAIVPSQVYVTAEFKETQLARLRLGQPVEIKVDAYPDLRLRGHVDSVQPATGNAFTPLPAQNAAGNWVKVVQRVPVKIAIDRLPDDPSRRLGPGMSVEVKVSVDRQ